MVEEAFSNIHNLLNTVVNGKIDEYEVDIQTGKLKGENFLGDIVFVCLKNKKNNDELHLVIKQAIDFGNMTQFSSVYPTEIAFYEEIWPTLNKFQETSSVGFNNIAKCYATSKTKGKEKLVLEDLNFQNYKIFDKTKPLDYRHLEHIFKCYGKYHAISFAFNELHPEEFAKLENLTNKEAFKSPENDDKKPKPENPFFTALRDLRSQFDEKTEADILKTFEELLEVLNNDGFQKIVETKSDVKILIHGDCWSNNMMFKYDENGDVVDMRFLDFQMINVGSPVKDLSYCFYSGASKESLDKLDDLLDTYINSFEDTLKKLNCKPENPYTIEKLKSEWKKFSFFGLCIAMGLWRIKLVGKKNIPKITDFDETENKAMTLPIVADEYIDFYNKTIKDLIVHFCINKFL